VFMQAAHLRRGVGVQGMRRVCGLEAVPTLLEALELRVVVGHLSGEERDALADILRRKGVPVEPWMTRYVPNETVARDDLSRWRQWWQANATRLQVGH
jgi:hypothetical protein